MVMNLGSRVRVVRARVRVRVRARVRVRVRVRPSNAPLHTWGDQGHSGWYALRSSGATVRVS